MMRRRLGSAHDRLFRALLERQDLVAELLRSFLPEDFALRTMDWSIVPIRDSFIREDLKLRQCDGLFRMQDPEGNEPDIIFLLEHKSVQDPWAPLQITEYVSRVWNRYRQQDSASPDLVPGIIPILIYQGKDPWRGPRMVPDMTSHLKDIVQVLAKFGFVLFDLVATITEVLAQQPELRSVLAALKHSRDVRMSDKVLHLILSGLREGTDLKTQVIAYILYACEVSKERLEVAVRETNPTREETQMGAYGQELFNQGRVEGKVEGRTEAIVEILHRRLGPVPDELKSQFSAAAASDPGTWFDTAARAESYADLLSANHPD